MFASDCPFDPEGGPGFIREGMRSVAELDVSDETRMKIKSANACAFLDIT